MSHNSKDNTYRTDDQLLGCHVGSDQARKLYTHELVVTYIRKMQNTPPLFP